MQAAEVANAIGLAGVLLYFYRQQYLYYLRLWVHATQT